MSGLELNGVNVWLGEQHVLKNIDLSVAQGECVALLGPSGCGKTTTLRTIAGFIVPQEGSVSIAGKSTKNLPPNKRNVGLVFQDYALFPHMTVSENIGYGLRMRKIDGPTRSEQVEQALAMVQLLHMKDRMPSQLSGGQRQRIALARALVIQPDILLLDEPLGALDRKLRDQMQVELKQLQKKLGITTIIVTHDQEEALSLADRVAVMFDGQIEEIGKPVNLYETPSSLRVMEFLGSSNILSMVVTRRDASGATLSGYHHYSVQVAHCAFDVNERITAAIRPEHIQILPIAEIASNTLEATTIECVYKGGLVAVHCRLSDGTQIKAQSDANSVQRLNLMQQGLKIALRLEPYRLQLFSPSSKERTHDRT
ncbi:MAG: polyamine ABC transporter ATP-binding protein [Alcaligenaceae bacterium]|nr:MAG: polyamine ABC transporter ATP-binding protein [Alcaligenaceae bacterium]